MSDRENIINNFKHEVNKAHGEGWDFVDLSTDDAKEILELLKEREAVKPSVDVDTYVCPNCGHRLEVQGKLGDNVIFDERYNFCPACGKEVKWDEAD